MRALRFKETERGSSSSVTDKYSRIRCPKCGWRPRKHDQWMCSCLHTWNTLDTRRATALRKRFPI